MWTARSQKWNSAHAEEEFSRLMSPTLCFFQEKFVLFMVHIKAYLVCWPATLESQTSCRLHVSWDFISSNIPMKNAQKVGVI